MIPDRSQIVTAAFRMLDACAVGGLVTRTGSRLRLWIGTPVFAVDDRTLVSELDGRSELVRAAEERPAVSWRLHDESGKWVFFFDGRMRAEMPKRPGSSRVRLYTDVESIVQVVAAENMVCRVVLPPIDRLRHGRVSALAPKGTVVQPCLAS